MHAHNSAASMVRGINVAPIHILLTKSIEINLLLIVTILSITDIKSSNKYFTLEAGITHCNLCPEDYLRAKCVIWLC